MALQSSTLCLRSLNKRIKKKKKKTQHNPPGSLLSPSPSKRRAGWLTGWWMPGGCPRLLAVRPRRVHASPCCWPAEEWFGGTSPGWSWGLLSPCRVERKPVSHGFNFLKKNYMHCADFALHWGHLLTQTPQSRRPSSRCPTSRAPRLLAAPLKGGEEPLWGKLAGKNQKSKRWLRLSDGLTCHFDFLHDLGGSVVDFHLDSDGIAVVINLDFRRDLLSEEKRRGRKNPRDFRAAVAAYL